VTAGSVLVDGAWCRTATGADVVNPADTDQVVGRVEWATPRLVEQAGAAAAQAFGAGRRTSAGERAALLLRIADRLHHQREPLARLAVQEQGKTLPEALGEVDRGAATFRYFAGQALDPTGDLLAPIKPGALSYAERVPLGPIAVITPFNFPILVPCWKLAPALAYGDTVVWKPSEATSLTAAALAQVLVDAGLPPGCVNLVPGGPDVGAAVVALPQLRGITFTGSTAVGRTIQRALAGRSVAVQLELGGKNPAVVLADAPTEATAASILKGIASGTGQRCTALSRALVPRQRHDELVEALSAAADRWRMGDGLDPGSMAGPLTTASARARIDASIAEARERGGSAITAGTVTSDRPGWWTRPTIVTGLTATDPLAVTELFGPVLVVLPHDGLDHAVELANATPFGLNAAVYTGDLAAAMAAIDRIEAGMVQVNADAGVAAHVPFIGVGDSGFGPSEQGPWAREFFTRAKAVNIHPGGQG
jgi:aldehyde dehydrogenase (NAD+)